MAGTPNQQVYRQCIEIGLVGNSPIFSFVSYLTAGGTEFPDATSSGQCQCSTQFEACGHTKFFWSMKALDSLTWKMKRCARCYSRQRMQLIIIWKLYVIILPRKGLHFSRWPSWSSVLNGIVSGSEVSRQEIRQMTRNSGGRGQHKAHDAKASGQEAGDSTPLHLFIYN